MLILKPRLEGKVCIVTDAGMLYGKVGIAVSLSRKSARVLVVDVREENATRTAQQIRDEKIGEPDKI